MRGGPGGAGGHGGGRAGTAGTGAVCGKLSVLSCTMGRKDGEGSGASRL